MRALVTNDDGIDSPGLAALAQAALEFGLDVMIAAPAVESSGTSAGLTAAEDTRRIISQRRVVPGLDGVEALAVEAHPGLISFVACRGGFGGTFDFVLSGVNRGANVGRAILHSGTVGAALTAQVNGVSGLAVSLDVGLEPQEFRWDTAVELVAAVLPMLTSLPAASVLNLNVPNRPVAEVKSLVWAELATFGAVQSKVDEVSEGVIELVTVYASEDPDPGSDADLLGEGRATLTPLLSVSGDPTIERPSPAWPR
ncbi:5'/3'-nucleotidase SurE [Lentzea sp. NBRC 105346]|uniref:5'/3'-nucleotidase SurE n=1 Tax=Lentzea sp. NBRC 105346 TaxID=3032205 RepID=UPI0024A0C044|nr:5'/3'-nucleotidase SurE [Lentzea sp. NBRC 105346]GLZ31072.1 5'/3'-nucleotidase SurE [Lentzea sp. NBRC 105346]